jgi:hypothetical protein
MVRGIKRTPHKAMFGVETKVGLTSSSLPDEIIKKILYKEEVINTFIFFCKQDLDGIYYCTFVQCCYILNMNERLKLVSDTQYMLHSLCL